MESEIKQLTKRFGEGTLSSDEQQTLKQLASEGKLDTDDAWIAEYFRATNAMHDTTCNIKLHQTQKTKLSVVWGVAAASLCALAVILTITLQKPTVYGYVNGKPITSRNEAKQQAENALKLIDKSFGDATAQSLETFNIDFENYK